jgi:serine/threonine-protein kinase
MANRPRFKTGTLLDRTLRNAEVEGPEDPTDRTAVPAPAAADPIEPVEPPPLPQSLVGGRFQILGLLGTGGMGSVYKARDIELDEVVALKMLKREALASSRALARFRQEVKIARRVTHPNVARTFDIGEHGTERFLTMEYIEGESLARLLAREGILPLKRVVEIALPLCAGLGAAHAAGVVHRDLKPDNVLLDTTGRVVITDFGTARISLDGGGPTQTVGTPSYMSPEQVEGTALDGRADLYALGVILYEMLTGDRPWHGTAFQVAAARLITPPPDPRQKNPGVPVAAAELVIRCLARQPDDRFASAGEVRAALKQLDVDPTNTDGTPVPAGPLLPVPRRDPMLAATSVADRLHTVAVLPFRNAGQLDDEHWADGFTEDLIETLSTVPGLKVRSRGAVIVHKRSDRDPRQLGWEMGVQIVVEGSLRRHAGGLKITVRLITVGDGFQIWARKFERPALEMMAVADEAAVAIAGALHRPAQVAPRSAARDEAALDLYLRARAEHHQFSRPSAVRARDLLVAALERSPDEGVVLGAYALSQARIWSLAIEEGDCRHQAVVAAERAAELAPQLGEPHLALATLYFQDLLVDETVQELRVALARTPSLAEAHEMVGRLLLEAGPIDEGLGRLEKAVQLEPQLHRARWEAARGHALRGQWSEAYILLERGEPSAAALAHQCRLALWNHDHARGMAIQQNGQKLNEGPLNLIAFLADTLFERPPDAATLELIEAHALTEGSRRRRLYFLQLLTETEAARGQLQGAMRHLQTAADLGLFDLNWLERCPLLASLRALREFDRPRARIAAQAKRVMDRLAGR